MRALMKVFAVAGFLLPSTLAAHCTGRLCSLEDETSLVQVKQVVTQGSERPEKDTDTIELLKKDAIEELVDTASAVAMKQAEAEAEHDKDDGSIWPFQAFEMIPRMDPMLDAAEVPNKAWVESQNGDVDGGEATSALFSNLERSKQQVVTRTADKLAFEDKVHDERKAQNKAALDSIRADKRAVVASMRADHAKVRAAFNHRIKVQKAAAEKVERAKEAWETHLMKKQQAATYAAEGRDQGEREGYDEAARKMDEWENSVIEAAADRRDAASKAAFVNGQRLERLDVEEDTAADGVAEKAAVADDKAAIRAATDDAEAKAAMYMD